MSRGRGQGHQAVVGQHRSAGPAGHAARKVFFGRQRSHSWAGRRSLAHSLSGVSGPSVAGDPKRPFGAVASQRANNRLERNPHQKPGLIATNKANMIQQKSSAPKLNVSPGGGSHARYSHCAIQKAAHAFSSSRDDFECAVSSRGSCGGGFCSRRSRYGPERPHPVTRPTPTPSDLCYSIGPCPISVGVRDRRGFAPAASPCRVVCMLTARDDIRDRVEALIPAPTTFINKPFSPSRNC